MTLGTPHVSAEPVTRRNIDYVNQHYNCMEGVRCGAGRLVEPLWPLLLEAQGVGVHLWLHAKQRSACFVTCTLAQRVMQRDGYMRRRPLTLPPHAW